MNALKIVTAASSPERPATPFLGLAPFLRMSIAGTDFSASCQDALEEAARRPADANLWMNLATMLLCLGRRDIGLAVQAQALSMQRVYELPAAEQPAKLRLLVLVAPGDLAANTPIDCLIEGHGIDLIFYYCSGLTPLGTGVPEHDAVFVAISEADAHRDTLARLQVALSDWRRPVINAPELIPNVERGTAAAMLQGIPGLLMPLTVRVARADLHGVATRCSPLAKFLVGADFPVILRPVGSHGGHDLCKIDSAAALAGYLAEVDAEAFYLSPFIDYSGDDGLFRKFRIALIGGEAFACHMAVSSDWMIHYVNAGMYEDAEKRADERNFMASFATFAKRHRVALAAIHERAQLDYLCIDCAETRDGHLLVFEIDHAMVVHAMDSEDLFPHKQHYIKKVRQAFQEYCSRLIAPLPTRKCL